MSLSPQPLLSETLLSNQPHISFEYFPPKSPEGEAKLYEIAAQLHQASPSYFSVTWGAGGSTSRNTVRHVSEISKSTSIPGVAHFTGLGMTPETVRENLKAFQAAGIRNVLVLRGDVPHTMDQTKAFSGGFRYASQLVEFIRKEPGFKRGEASLMVAGAPEGHPEAKSYDDDMDHVARKVKIGADAVITQFFLNNDHFYRFEEALRRREVKVPIAVGIMIILKAQSIQKMISLSGCEVPAEVQQAIERYATDDASMQSFGIDFATRQIRELMTNGIRHFHFYTMNQSEPVLQVLSNLKDYLQSKATRTVSIEYREYIAYPDAKITDLFRRYDLDPNKPHTVIYNQALRRYEITQ